MSFNLSGTIPETSPTHPTQLTAAARRRWREARGFQTKAQQILAHQMTFTEWLLLETIEELASETPDAVTQSAIAGRRG